MGAMVGAEYQKPVVVLPEGVKPTCDRDEGVHVVVECLERLFRERTEGMRVLVIPRGVVDDQVVVEVLECEFCVGEDLFVLLV